MPRKSLPTRLAATAALLLAAGVLSAPAASAEPADPAPGAPFVLTVSANPASTDRDHRTVDVTGTLTRADGTPVAGVPVTVQEVVVFTTWNPWGDPIDPTYTEPRELGKPVTGADGTFGIPGVDIDHLSGSSLLNVQHGVEITALHDEDGDLDTPEDGVWGGHHRDRQRPGQLRQLPAQQESGRGAEAPCHQHLAPARLIARTVTPARGGDRPGPPSLSS